MSDKARSHTSRRLAEAQCEDYATRTFEPVWLRTFRDMLLGVNFCQSLYLYAPSGIRLSRELRAQSFAGKTRPPEEFSTRLLLRIPVDAIKEKNTTRGGVFSFMVHLQGFEPGTHWLRVSCSTNWAKGASLLSVDNYSTTVSTFQAYFYKRAIFTMSKKVFDHKIRKKIMINKT